MKCIVGKRAVSYVSYTVLSAAHYIDEYILRLITINVIGLTFTFENYLAKKKKKKEIGNIQLIRCGYNALLPVSTVLCAHIYTLDTKVSFHRIAAFLLRRYNFS